MLVLNRKRGERIYVCPDVVITIIEIEPGRVRVGIEAPRDVGVYRDDVIDVETAAEVVKASQQKRRKN